MLQLESLDRAVSDTMENLATRYRNANPYTRTRIYDRSMGALLLGVNFQCVYGCPSSEWLIRETHKPLRTYGILLGMAFIYHRRSTEDPRWLRLSVSEFPIEMHAPLMFVPPEGTLRMVRTLSTSGLEGTHTNESFFCTFCVAISLHGIYWFTIIHYNDPTALQSAPW